MTRGKSVEEQKLDLLFETVNDILIHLKFPLVAEDFRERWKKIEGKRLTVTPRVDDLDEMGVIGEGGKA